MSLMCHNKWYRRFLFLAKEVASWSKDGSTQVGSVLVAPPNKFLGLGYNGFAPGVDDSQERLSRREVKLLLTLHAEENALLSYLADVRGATCYVWPFQPCSLCAARLISRGIKRVVSISNDTERWAASFGLAREQFNEAGVALDLYSDFTTEGPVDESLLGVVRRHFGQWFK